MINALFITVILLWWYNHEVLAAPKINYRRKIITKTVSNHYDEPYLVLSLSLFSLKSAMRCVAMRNIIGNFAYEKV